MTTARIPLLLATLLALLLGGCLKRKETIVLHPDGRLDVVHAFVGDGDDIDSGPARRPDGPGYVAERSTRVLEDGEIETTWTARASYASAKAMPTSFAAADDPFADRAHRFRTEVHVRKEEGRTYYRFVRTYEARDWATYRYYRRVCFPKDIEELYEDPDAIADLSLEDRKRLIGAIVKYHCMQMQLWADRATGRVAPSTPELVDVQLAIRARIAAYCRRELAPERVVGVLSGDTGEAAALADGAQAALRILVVDHARKALALTEKQAADVELALLREQHDFDVSHDLDDEDFVVRLKMPGRVLGSNADKTEGGALVWEFHAHDLRDRRHVLIATSVVEK